MRMWTRCGRPRPRHLHESPGFRPDRAHGRTVFRAGTVETARVEKCSGRAHGGLWHGPHCHSERRALVLLFAFTLPYTGQLPPTEANPTEPSRKGADHEEPQARRGFSRPARGFVLRGVWCFIELGWKR